MRVYSNNAYEAQLNVAADDIQDTLELDTVTNWPVPTGGDVAVAGIDFGNPDTLEVVTYSGVTGTTLTGVVRGLDGTTARAHGSGVSVRHVASAADLDRLYAGELVATGATPPVDIDFLWLDEDSPGESVPITTSHNDLQNLDTGDFHTQYALTDGTRGDFEPSGSTAAHEAASDPHTQYALGSGEVAPTPDTLVARDVAGRAKVIDGIAADDVVTKGQLDSATPDLSEIHATNAQQNVRLWQLEADVLGSAEGFSGWQGEGFLVGQDEVASLTGLKIDRNADLDVGALGIFSGDLDDWTSLTSGSTETLFGVAYDGSVFVVVGTSGEILTSPDGVTWTSRTSGSTETLYGVGYGGSLFVAVSGSGEILTSPDGVTWTAQTSGSTAILRGVAYDGSVFVVVGTSGEILTSPDGVTWTAQTSGSTETLYGVGYGGSLFVAVGGSGEILTSPDGVTWTSRTSGSTESLRGVGYGGSLFVAVSGSGEILTSPDGVTWTAQTSGSTAILLGVAYDGSVFVVAGGSGEILTSPDGVTWTSRTSGSTETLFGVGYGGSLFVVAGGSGEILTAESGTADTGTLTLVAVTLPATADSVYLLDDATLDAGVTLTYEATLDGGTTWETVTPGQAVTLAHSGTSFALRASMSRATDATDEGRVFWFIGYAS